jgi:hypothetical protein
MAEENEGKKNVRFSVDEQQSEEGQDEEVIK